MNTIFKKLWHDPVWSKVIAGVILAIGATVTTYLLNWWSDIGEIIDKSIALALASTSTPNWLLLLLTLAALLILIFLGALVWESIFPSQADSSSWRDYTTDEFFGLRWRWMYGISGQIGEAHTFCPHCDFQVYAQNVSAFSSIDHIAFHCDSCHRNLGEFQESFNLLENKVIRLVQQKLRNGTWVFSKEN